jgi:hypothetical protein
MTPSPLRPRLSRRELLGGLGALGTGTLLFRRPSAAQSGSGAPAKHKVINVHHHLTSPGYVKLLNR